MANVSASGRQRARRGSASEAGPAGPSVDYATILGVLGAFGVISAAMVLGGAPESFVDIPSVLIVLGGTLLVTTASFTLEEMRHTLSVMSRAVLYHAELPSDAAQRILGLALRARRSGPLSLTDAAKSGVHSRFLSQALQLVADGLPGDEIEQILRFEHQATQHRHVRSAGVLRRAGEVSPAMGLIGTLVGLVQMLGNLDDPSTIGPSMAVALLTTFYGAVLANMLFHPLATKLERNSEIEAQVNRIYMMGAASIGRQENPRRLEMMINTILSPAERVSYFD
jgi:chemotaxis protein MotA